MMNDCGLWLGCSTASSRVQGSQRRLRLTLDNGKQDHRGVSRLSAMLFPILNCLQLHTEQLSKLRLRQSGPLPNHLDVWRLDLEDPRGLLLATHNAAASFKLCTKSLNSSLSILKVPLPIRATQLLP